MEIDTNMNLGPVNGLSAAAASAAAAGANTPPETAQAAAADSFASTSALEAALKNAPDVREDVVAEGRALAANTDYPDDSTVKQLSDFLASQLQSDIDQ